MAKTNKTEGGWAGVELFNNTLDVLFHHDYDCVKWLCKSLCYEPHHIDYLKRVVAHILPMDDYVVDEYYDNEKNFDEVGGARNVFCSTLDYLYHLKSADDYKLMRGNVLIDDGGCMYIVCDDTVSVKCPVPSNVDGHPLKTQESVDFVNCVRFTRDGDVRYVELNSRYDVSRSNFYKENLDWGYMMRCRHHYYIIEDVNRFMDDLRDASLFEKMLSVQNNLIRQKRIADEVEKRVEEVRYEQEMAAPAQITVREWKSLLERIKSIEEDVSQCYRRSNYDY